MSHHVDDNAPHGADPAFPPGTTVLINTYSTSSDSSVVLSPVPSSDPNDPLNWAPWRRNLHYGLVCSISVAIFTGLSTQSVFWGPMTQEISVTYKDLTYGQAVQLAGLGLSCVVFVPFTKKYGRRFAYLISAFIITISCWWSAYMNTAWENYVINFLLGVGGSINEVVVEMTVADLFFVHRRATANGFYMGAVLMGTFLTPMIAGIQAAEQGWRAVYITLASIMTVLSIIFVFAFEESKYISLKHDTPENVGDAPVRGVDTDIKQSIEEIDRVEGAVITTAPTMDASTKSASEQYKYSLRLFTPTTESLWKVALHPLYTAFMPQVVFCWLLYAAGLCANVVFGSVIAIVFAAPPYNFSPAGIGLMYTGPSIGVIFGFFYGGLAVDWAVVRLARRNNGIFEAEYRLYLLPIPVMLMAAGLILFGITADKGMHYVYPSIGGGLFAFSSISVIAIIFTYVIDSYPGLVSQMFVAITFFRNAFGLIGVFAITDWIAAMGVTNVFLTCAGINIGISLFAIPLIIWGKRIRSSLAPRYYKLCKEAAENHL